MHRPTVKTAWPRPIGRGASLRSPTPRRTASWHSSRPSSLIREVRPSRTWRPHHTQARRLAPRHRPRRVLCPAPSTITAPSCDRRDRIVQLANGAAAAPSPGNEPFAHAIVAPTTSGSIDFKGWFRTGDGTRVRSPHHRAGRGLSLPHRHWPSGMERPTSAPETRAANVSCATSSASTACPQAIRTDNGPPFAGSRCLGSLSPPSPSWLDASLGIRVPERIGSRDHPPTQGNGRLERLHRTLKAETCVASPGPTSETSQPGRKPSTTSGTVYNNERPARGPGSWRPPVRLYTPSFRAAIPHDAQLAGSRTGPQVTVRTEGAPAEGWASFKGWTFKVGQSLCERVYFGGEPIGRRPARRAHLGRYSS